MKQDRYKKGTTMPAREKRANRRFIHNGAVSCINAGDITSDPTDILWSIELVDVSNGGLKLCIEGVSAMKEETILQVGIPLNGIEVSIPVLGRIKWVRRIEPMRYNVGVQFLA
jgi:hypothetical protein